MTITLQAIGVVRSPRQVVEDDNWGGVVSTIELDRTLFEADATLNIELFSHLEVIFHMDRVPDDKIERGARHPRNNPKWPKMGILAQRTKNRVNRLGLSRCALVKVDGLTLTVQGLDAVDGTPVVDIKPYLRGFEPRGAVREPEWTSDIMKDYYR